MATTASKVSKTGVASAVLNGRIEAIGVKGLLRVAMARLSTGRLCLCSEESNAELFFRQGQLVQMRWDKPATEDGLKCLLEMKSGEFEFVRGEECHGEAQDETLHSVLLQLMAGESSSDTHDQTPFSEMPPRVRVSGVHRLSSRALGSELERTSLPPVSQERHSSFLLGSLLPQETGRAIVDRGGRVLEQLGRISTRDANCMAALTSVSFDLASVFETTGLERIEVRQAEGRSLFGRMSRDGLRLSVVEHDEAISNAVWQELEL